MINQFRHREEIIETKTNHGASGTEVTIGENKYLVTEVSRGKYSVVFDGVIKHIYCIVKNEISYLDIDGLLLELTIPSEDGTSALAAGGHAGEKDKIFAPMPGKIVKLLVKEGEKITEKHPMVIVEAMKMENQVNSPAAGRVKKINFKDGDQVGTEVPIIELEL
ncbi:MAG: hypothetical protein NTV06_09120 [candidate division Zixibacteria bacterium]|nr:hypothetical protein [candidate division Zixibacteria bacterium]